MEEIAVTCQGADTLPIDAIADFQHGLKSLSKANLEKLQKSILKYGFTAPIFVWQHAGDNYILDGHQRLAALLDLREKGYDIPLLPVAYIEAADEREAKEKLLHISSQYGEIELQGLDLFIEGTGIQLEELNLRIVNTEINLRRRGEDKTEGDDEILEPVKKIAKEGDLWQLGGHYVVCGDATDRVAVERLLGDVEPHLMVTDPPYGVEYDPSWRAKAGVNKNKKKMGKVSNDDRVDWREAWELFPGDVAYVWHAGLYAGTVAGSLEVTGFEIRSQIVWAKDRFALSRGHYHWQHEPCWYAVKSKGHWEGDRSQSTLWSIKSRDDDGHGHGTQKPLECMLRPILNNSSPGQAVYDPFLGSGTTLIAAEKSGRICYGIELDPGYVDITILRYLNWCTQNGHKITLKQNGKRYPYKQLLAIAASENSEGVSGGQ